MHHSTVRINLLVAMLLLSTTPGIGDGPAVVRVTVRQVERDNAASAASCASAAETGTVAI
jgi:hypothetical protein